MPQQQLNAMSPAARKAKGLTDSTFAERLNTACDENDNVPNYGQGRQTWVREKLDVSHEAVRKWFTGESRPRHQKMKALAELLGVDEAWLALGVKPDMKPRDQRRRNAAADGAVNYVAGLLQLSGTSVAFPDPADSEAEYVDLYVIANGKQNKLNVSLARAERDNSLRFILPSNYSVCRHVGVITDADSDTVRLLCLPVEVIEKFGKRKGGFVEVRVATNDERTHFEVSGETLTLTARLIDCL